MPAPWFLKGGYALELRFKAARSTVDIDLTLQQVMTTTSASGDTNQVVREMLQGVADVPLSDWFEYVIGPPVMDLTAAPYGGARHPVEARMDERTFARFHLDAGIGDVVMQPLDTIVCRDWLGFAGIESSRVQMIAREQQFAEKIHAYTLPRNTLNSRVKDLVDLALLIGSGGLDKQRILEALVLTFERRGTHDLLADLRGPVSSPGRRVWALGGCRDSVYGCTAVLRRSNGTEHGAMKGLAGNGRRFIWQFVHRTMPVESPRGDFDSNTAKQGLLLRHA